MKKSWLPMLPIIAVAMAPTISWAAPENPPAITPVPSPETAMPFKVRVTGAVNYPRSFMLPGDGSFLSALRAAGGLQKTDNFLDNPIDLSNIKVKRNGEVLTVNMDALLKGDNIQNIRLQNGDVIIVSRVRSFLSPPHRFISSRNLALLPNVPGALPSNREKPPVPGARGFPFNSMTVYIVPLGCG